MKNERVAIQREGEETYGRGTSGKVRAVRRPRRGSAAGTAIPVDSTSK
jgi:hypothetical protein